MNKELLNAAKDEAAREYGHNHYSGMLYDLSLGLINTSTADEITARAMEIYASQQRTEGIREGFSAARAQGIRKRTYDGVGEVSVYGNLYQTVDDYLNSKQ